MVWEIEKWFKFINYQCSEAELQKTLEFFSKEREEIRVQIDNLSWSVDFEKQQQAIDYLSTKLLPSEYVYLIMADKYQLKPFDNKTKYYRQATGKERWENAAKTIVKIGWPKVDSIIVPMFMWLLDPNWPGSEMIYDFMFTLPKDVLNEKIKLVLDNPQNYDHYNYLDLKEHLILLSEIINENGKND